MRKDHYNLLSLLQKHHCNHRSVQQIHAHLVTTTATAPQTPPPISLWTAVLRHYSLGNSPSEALLLYKHHLHPTTLFHGDSFTYAFLIKSCANSHLPISGSQLHSLTFKFGFQTHVYVQTALVNMYVVCGCLLESRQVFDEMPERNLVTWNVLVTGLAKLGEITLARSFFDVMPIKNVVSWSGMIDGYTRANQPKEAITLFKHMVALPTITPTEITILAVHPAIWTLGSLELCQSIHAYGEKNGLYTIDIRVTNALIDVYSRCGSVESALRVFESITSDKRNLVSWTSIISVFAMHGMAREAVDKFRRMEEVGMKPNRVTFLSVLSACSHGGLVEQGLVFFKKMVDESRIVPDIKHYGCLVDMLARAGRLEEAEKVALKVPKDLANGVVIWRMVLGACSSYNDVEIGKRVTRRIFEKERGYSSDYVLLSNIYSGVGDFVDSEKVRREMDEMGVCKPPGHSYI